MTTIEPKANRPQKWLIATARKIVVETPRVKTLVLDVPDWPGHLPGQHVDVRLTAEDGYQAKRSYSIASPPEDGGLTLTVELADGGEVSDYLVNELKPGDKFGVRGPIGRHFVWTVAEGGPLFLIGGGSGIVPLMSMLRHRKRQASKVPAALLYSSRSFEDIIYRSELEALAADPSLNVTITLTRSAPHGWLGPVRRISKAMLEEAGFGPQTMPQIFICGSNSLVETVSKFLIELGHAPALIKTERFGPSS
ncbi:MAG: ferredoxin reductase [Rhodomicrobium sp.]